LRLRRRGGQRDFRRAGSGCRGSRRGRRGNWRGGSGRLRRGRLRCGYLSRSGLRLRLSRRGRIRFCGGRRRTWDFRPGGSHLDGAGALDRCGETIERDNVRVDVAYRSVAGLNLRENKAVNQNGEAFAAGHGGHYVGRLPGFAEYLSAFGMGGAINEADVVGPCGRGRQKRKPQENKDTYAEHRPLLGSPYTASPKEA
jgi:hypothetical protein